MNTKPLFKALGLLFALMLVFAFSACSDDDTGGGGDTTAPTWTAAPALSGSPTTNAAAIGFTLNEAGTVFWKVMANGAVPPSSSQVTNDNNFVLAAAAVGGIINLTGLTADTAYDVFVVAKDTAGNLQTAPLKVDVLTASNGGSPPTGPVWLSNPTPSGINQNDVTVSYALDENCTVYYLVMPNGSPAPSAANIKTNGNRTYNTAPAVDSVWLQSLFNSTDYDVYFVANDGLADSEIRLVEFRTADPPPSVINLTNIPGVTAPVAGATPVTNIDSAQYTGTVSWSGSPATFAASTVYTATITLTAKAGWTLTGVGANSFNVADATNVSNAADSGVVTAIFPATAGGGPVYATTLIISEYVEGVNFNKQIEIFNGTGSSVDLSGYKLCIYANGAATPTGTMTLSGTLPHNTAVVATHGSATNYFTATFTNSTVINYNGDDAIALLTTGDVLVDAFGTIGTDPGTGWTSGSASSVDKTLVRKATVKAGFTDTANFVANCLATEWDVYPVSTFTYLGSHTMNY